MQLLISAPAWRVVARPAALSVSRPALLPASLYILPPAAVRAYVNGSSSSIPSGMFIKPSLSVG